MFLQYSRTTKHRRAFTMVEIMVGATILAIIGGMVAHWFVMQRRYQTRILALSDAQQNIRQASWNMIQELRTARNLIYPRLNPDKSIKSSTKTVFKNFSGDIICYYFQEDAGEIRRCVIPNDSGPPQVDSKPVGKGIDKVYFTAHDIGNRLLGIYLESGTTVGLESVYLLNE